MPKLLGAYKLAINGEWVAAGPGRSRDGVIGVDHIENVSSLLREGQNVVTIAGFHANKNNTSTGPWMPGATVPGIAFGLRVGDGRGNTTVRTDGSWSAFNAERVFNPGQPTQGTGW